MKENKISVCSAVELAFPNSHFQQMAAKNKGLELENGPFQAFIFHAAIRIFLLGKSSNAPSTEILKCLAESLPPARAAKGRFN